MNDTILNEKKAEIAAVMAEYRSQLQEYEKQLLKTIEEYEDAVEKIRVKQLRDSLT